MALTTALHRGFFAAISRRKSSNSSLLRETSINALQSSHISTRNCATDTLTGACDQHSHTVSRSEKMSSLAIFRSIGNVTLMF